VLPYLAEDARDDLLKAGAAAAAAGGALEITSAYRTVVQQYLLRRWFELGRCGIAAAAEPGSSNHESGRAVDIRNHAAWGDVLPQYGWVQTVPGDDVHFDHVASPDDRGADVLAFQRLWNRNHAGDRLDEDGVYGPQTARRVAQAPAEGFESGAACGDGGGDGDGDGDGGGDGMGGDGYGGGGGGCAAGGPAGLVVGLALLGLRRRSAVRARRPGSRRAPAPCRP